MRLMEIVSEWICDRLPTPYRVSILRNYIRIQMKEEGEFVKLTIGKGNAFLLHNEEGELIRESDYIGNVINRISEYV